MIIGENTVVYSPNHCTIDETRPWMIEIGSNVSITEGVTILTHGYDWSVFKGMYGDVLGSAGRVKIGDNVFIGPSCGFHTAGHPIDAPRRNAGLEYARPITVGSDVWFGAGVQVTPGVTIGSNVVIGAGSVVTRDIPSDCVAAGNPCRPLRPIPESSRKI